MSKLSKKIISRYSDRFQEFGNDVRTLGWGSKEQQNKRFNEFKKHIKNINETSIVDFGCGFGDFYKYLGEESCLKYIGIDINQDLIKESKSDFNYTENVQFICADIYNNKAEKPIANVGVMIGVLNLNFGDTINNFEFSKQLIKNAFTYVEEKLIVDFISFNTISEYPKEEFIYYHKPSEVLEFCLSLTNNVSLFHDYSPIPQKEFLVCLQK